jgi:hypothetical protein
MEEFQDSLETGRVSNWLPLKYRSTEFLPGGVIKKKRMLCQLIFSLFSDNTIRRFNTTKIKRTFYLTIRPAELV